jgi:hypothetical protein
MIFSTIVMPVVMSKLALVHGDMGNRSPASAGTAGGLVPDAIVDPDTLKGHDQ